MNTFQLSILLIFFIGLVIHAFMHGRPRMPFSFWWKLADIISILTLLYLGNFFSPLLPSPLPISLP